MMHAKELTQVITVLRELCRTELWEQDHPQKIEAQNAARDLIRTLQHAVNTAYEPFVVEGITPEGHSCYTAPEGHMVLRLADAAKVPYAFADAMLHAPLMPGTVRYRSVTKLADAERREREEVGHTEP